MWRREARRPGERQPRTCELLTVPLVNNGAIEFAHLTDPMENRFGIWRPKAAR